MAIRGITFDNQTPTAASQRAMMANAVTDGVLSGTLSFSGSQFSISNAFVIIGGAVVQVDANGATLAVSGSGYARIKGRIDTSKASTSSSFAQFSLTFDTASTLGGFSALQHDDINVGSNKIYEAEICVVRIGANGIVRRASAMPKIPHGTSLPAVGAEGEIFLLKV